MSVARIHNARMRDLVVSAEAAAAQAAIPAAPIEIPQPVSPEMLAGTELSLGDRVNLVRDFTRDNPARAALAVRDMMRAEDE